jgi:hypothetical protein
VPASRREPIVLRPGSTKSRGLCNILRLHANRFFNSRAGDSYPALVCWRAVFSRSAFGSARPLQVGFGRTRAKLVQILASWSRVCACAGALLF